MLYHFDESPRRFQFPPDLDLYVLNPSRISVNVSFSPREEVLVLFSTPPTKSLFFM